MLIYEIITCGLFAIPLSKFLNEVSTLYSFSIKYILPGGSSVNNYFTSNTAWFIKTNAPDGMTYVTRQEVEFDQDLDFGTSNIRFKAIERYAFGWTDPRGAYASPGV